MPIYEYRCERCGQVSEYLIMNRQEQMACKQCGSESLTKILSAHNTPSNTLRKLPDPGSGSCCGTPNSCGTPGSCCSG